MVRRCGDATRAGQRAKRRASWSSSYELALQLVIHQTCQASGAFTEIIRDESELNDVIDDALFWVGMRARVVGLVAVAFSNEVGTITTLSKCSSKLAMLTGNGQRTLAVR